MKVNFSFLFILSSVCMCLNLQAQNLRPQADKKGRFGYVDEAGNKVISYKYAEAYPFEEGLAKVKKGDKYGFIDVKGNSVGKIKYSLILPFTGSYCRVAVGGSYKNGILQGEKWGILNKKGEEVLKPEYDEIGEFDQGITYILKGKQYGLINEQMDILLEPKYVAVGMPDRFGNIWFASSGKINKKSGKIEGAKYGLLNKEGKVIIPAKYAYIGYFYKYKVVGNPDVTDYDASTSSFYNKYSLEKPLTRLFDTQNYLRAALYNVESPEKEDSIRLGFNNMEILTDSTFFLFGKNTLKMGVMDIHGDVVVPEGRYNTVSCPSDGIAKVGKIRRKKLHYGYYNIQTGFLKEFAENEFLYSYTDGVGKVLNTDSNSVYFVDKSGNKITEVFGWAMNFDKGLCIVQDASSKKWGIIDNKGTEVVPMKYDAVKPHFTEDLLGVCQSGKWGVIDRSGKLVISQKYSGITDFRYGWAGVSVSGKWGMIDKTGKVVADIEWDDMKLITEAEPILIWGKKGELWYCFDRVKKTLAFITGYNDAYNFKNDMAIVNLGGKYGAVGRKGDVIVPCVMATSSRLNHALDYMNYLGKNKLNETDAFRLNIYEDPLVNSYKITDKIPDEKWDY